MTVYYDTIRSKSKKLIASRLAEARIDCGLNQTNAGQRIGLDNQAIRNMEIGKRRVPADELILLSCSYRVSIAWIVGEDTASLAEHRVARKMKYMKEDCSGGG